MVKARATCCQNLQCQDLLWRNLQSYSFISEFAVSEFEASEFAVSEHTASEFAVSEFAESEFAVSEITVSEFAVPGFAVAEFAKLQFHIGVCSVRIWRRRALRCSCAFMTPWSGTCLTPWLFWFVDHIELQLRTRNLVGTALNLWSFSCQILFMRRAIYTLQIRNPKLQRLCDPNHVENQAPPCANMLCVVWGHINSIPCWMSSITCI